ncbi:hypothetical protein [Candidatus Spongiihabitans sp.]
MNKLPPKTNENRLLFTELSLHCGDNCYSDNLNTLFAESAELETGTRNDW